MESMANLFTERDHVYHVKPNNFYGKQGHQKFRMPQKKSGAIILIYAPWCSHCNDPEWINKYKTMGKLFERNNLNTFAMNATEPKNEEWMERENINGLPTIMMANQKGEMKEYEGERELEPMVMEFVNYLTKDRRRRKK